MQAPSTGFISTALDELVPVNGFDYLLAEIHELGGLSDPQLQTVFRIANGIASKKLPPATAGFYAGYILGLQTARAILRTHPLLQLKGINPDALL